MHEAVVYLPARFNVLTMYGFVAELIDRNGQPLHRRVVFDFSRLRFIEGDGLTVFSNTLEWLLKQGIGCHFRNHDGGTNALRYLDDCGFFRMYLGAPLSASATVRETTLPLRKVRHVDSHCWLENDLSYWLAYKLNTTPASLYDVRVCLKEIFNNISDHSMEDTGCIHIQWYPNKNKINVAISDFGRGIPAAIAERYQVENDADAILLAIRDGVTTKPGPWNRGAGLSVLIDYVVISNGGSVSIHSGFGAVRCWPSGRGMLKRGVVGLGHYPGTLFNVKLRTDTVEWAEAEREDLEW